MLFSDKLVFLMNLTTASNKSLAQYMQVDPSMVSRLRKGHQDSPSSVDYVISMSRYFAENITSDYQRAALAETLNNSQLRLILKLDIVAEEISSWLLDLGIHTSEQRNVSNVQTALRSISNYSQPKETTSLISDYTLPETAVCRAFFGNVGKREAIMLFIKRLLSLKNPCEIQLFCDGNLEWLVEDSRFSSAFSILLTQFIQSGFSISRIAPQLNDIADSMDSFLRWLPAYMTGKIESWYYPRLRDNLLHRMLAVAPGIGAISSDSVGFQSESEVTFLYDDSQIANSLSAEYQLLLKKCVPLTIAHQNVLNGTNLLDLLVTFTASSGKLFRKIPDIPADSSPQSLLERFRSENVHLAYVTTSLCTLFTKRLSHSTVIDYIRLASLKDILEGKVPIPLSYLNSHEVLYYSPLEYRQHLIHLLELMKEYPNYTVAIDTDPESTDFLSAIEGQSCLLFRNSPPFTIFEIRESHIVGATQDYILKTIEGLGSKSYLRKQTIDTIKTLVQQLPSI